MSQNKIYCTIFCPVYNKARDIRRCFDSILMQKTKFKYKILVIDDKSTDDSVSIINEYVENYPEIFEFYQNENNSKTLATSIKGYELIKTPYYCVLDPDDYWLDNDHLDSAIKFLQANKNYTMYATNTWMEDDKNNRKPLNNFDFKQKSFNFKDGWVYTHTSSTFFVNTFNYEIISKLKNFIGTENERVFEGDSFRNMLAMDSGLAYVNNVYKSVYNFGGSGIWSGLNAQITNILNIRLYLQGYKFFSNNYTCLLRYAKDCINYYFQNDTENCDIKVIKEINELFKEFIYLLEKENILTELKFEKDIYFFLPSRNLGGYETCFIRMAKYLSETFNLNIHFIDYKDGFAFSELKNTSVNLLEYQEGKTPETLVGGGGGTVFAPITLAYQMPFKNVKKVKVAFWWAHPYSFLWLQYRCKKKLSSLMEFLQTALSKNAIYFMDYACEDSCNKIVDNSNKKPYLPVFTNKSQKFTKKELINEQEINIGWLGRLDDDKIYSLLNILQNFSNYKTDKKKIIHIIGSGNSENLIIANNYPSLNIKMTGKLVNENLDEYLTNNIDILFGMGASLLEAAKLKVPAVLIKLFNKPTLSNEFVWLFNLKSYILGYEDSNCISNCKINTFKEILDDIYQNNKKLEYMENCFSHFYTYHLIDTVACKFLLNISKSNLRWKVYQQKGLKYQLKKLKLKIKNLTKI